MLAVTMPRIVTNISDVKLLSAVSGTYVTPSRRKSGLVVSATLDTEVVRLDVDGYFPQMVASGSQRVRSTRLSSRSSIRKAASDVPAEKAMRSRREPNVPGEKETDAPRSQVPVRSA